MANKATINSTVGVAGFSFSGLTTIEDESSTSQDFYVPKALSGELDTRTDDNTGIITLPTGHGASVGDVIDVSWSGGSRQDMSVTAVSGDDVTIDGGTGDVLPAVTTAMVYSKTITSTLAFDADDLDVVACQLEGAGTFRFMSSSAVLVTYSLVAGSPWIWHSESGFPNPIAPDSADVSAVASIRISTTDTSADQRFRIGLLANSL